MANLYGYQFRKSPVPEVWDLFFKINIGASGAPTIVTANGASKGLASIVRNGAGDYTLTLTQTWNQLLFLKVIYDSGASTPAAGGLAIRTNLISTAKTLRITTYTGSTPTDPASGEVMYLQMLLKNSTAY